MDNLLSGVGQCCEQPIMKSYIGAKIIRAIPMSDLEFEQERAMYNEAQKLVKTYKRGSSIINDKGCNLCPSEPRDVKVGYKVMYPDGYMSWSPKHVFEQAYRIISKEESNLI